ncbi:MAG: hypothetical protein ACRC9L_03050, partial [Brevinema sp.]
IEGRAFMKRKILFSTIFLCLIGGVFALITFSSAFKINGDVTKIIVRNGNNGEQITLISENEISEIVNEINILKLKREHKIGSSTGWEIMLALYSKDCDPVNLTIRNNGIEYNNWFYKAHGNTIPFFNTLKEMFIHNAD